jgi:hypothetical protein
VRNVISLGAVVDGKVASDGKLFASGAVARLRLGDFLELGAGARLATAKSEDGTWQQSKFLVAQGGFHAALTGRFALPLGLDVAWGGDKALSNQITAPIGVRYTSRSGRWYGTLHPATLSWTKRDGDWGFGVTSGLEFGATL